MTDTGHPLISSNIRMDGAEMEASLYSVLGEFFVRFARVELNLSLRIGGSGYFEKKLERFFDSLTDIADNEDMLSDGLAWFMAADAMRQTRNLLAHGRWGYQVHLQRVVHVSGYPPGIQNERYFSFNNLDAIVRDLKSLDVELNRLPLWPEIQSVYSASPGR